MNEDIVKETDVRIGELAEIILEDSQHHEGSRTTVIVGSGASGTPSTDDLKQALFDEVEQEIFDCNARVTFGRKNAQACTLEQLFSIYAKVRGDDERAVYNLLRKNGIQRQDSDIMPLVGYEFLAHLLHHGFVRNIISTNFDEKLEISLKDEIGEGEYRWVKSLSEFDALKSEAAVLENEEERTRFWYVKPNLFKSHGTVSLPLTLRPTTETVQRFEDPKFDIFKRILDETRILIIVGYSFSDPDFRDVLWKSINQRREGDLRIYWADTKASFYKDNEMFQDVKAYCARKYGNLNNPVFLGKDCGECFDQLADSIHGLDKTTPTVIRHKIRNLIFSKRPQVVRDIDEKRFLLEVIIFAVKTKGMFSLEALFECDRITNCCAKLLSKGKAIQVLYHELVEANILHRHMGTDIFYVRETDKDLKPLANKILELFNIPTLEKEKEELEKLLAELQNEFDIDIGSPDISLYLKFRGPIFIKNLKELQEYGEKVIKGAQKKLMIVAQTGEWMTREGNRVPIEDLLQNGGMVQLILCKPTVAEDTMHPARQADVMEKLTKMREGKKGQMKIKYLPWGERIEHIKLNEKGQGIYLTRKGKSVTIVPVWLDEKEDYEKLKGIFRDLWRRSKPDP